MYKRLLVCLLPTIYMPYLKVKSILMGTLLPKRHLYAQSEGHHVNIWYIIIFYDDFTSLWIKAMCNKNEVLPAT